MGNNETSRPTLSAELEIDHISDLDIDDTEETLVRLGLAKSCIVPVTYLSLKFTLIKDLHGHDG